MALLLMTLSVKIDKENLFDISLQLKTVFTKISALRASNLSF